MASHEVCRDIHNPTCATKTPLRTHRWLYDRDSPCPVLTPRTQYASNVHTTNGRTIIVSKAEKELIFVYNAKSGFLNGLADLVHKGISPQTYPCRLCQLTYRGASMDEVWRTYVDELSIPATFLHKDEFDAVYPDEEYDLPVILLRSNADMIPLVTAHDFESITDLPELISQLDEALSHQNKANTVYQCPECRLHYDDRETAEACGAWCAKYKSCNLDITKHSLESRNLFRR